MQTTYGQKPGGLSQQMRRVAFFAILLFSLSGLIVGFAVGVYVRPKNPQTNTTGTQGNQLPITAQNTKTATRTPKPENVNLGEPMIGAGDYTFTQKANGGTSYSFSASIVYKGTHTLIQESDVTCKIWLTKDGAHTSQQLKANNYAYPKAIAALNQPSPDEVPNSLNFGSSGQVQPCTPNGKTTWNYTVSPSVDRGLYFIMVLTDWQGKHFNWSWAEIKVNHNGD